MKRRGFLLSSIAAALAAGVSLPELERRVLGAVTISYNKDGVMLVDCGGRTVLEMLTTMNYHHFGRDVTHVRLAGVTEIPE